MPLEFYLSHPTIVTKSGQGFDQLKTPSAEALRVEPLLSDRKVLKTISSSASWGLASLHRLKVEQGLKEPRDPYRRGLFAAAPAPYTSDKASYLGPAGEAAKHANPLHRFGQLYDGASPTTALMGLPNGVMCFAANLLKSLGPHGTYVDRERSVHGALAAGMLNAKMGRLDDFVVLGFADTSEPFFLESLRGFAQENTGIEPPRSTLIGGFASFLSHRLTDFSRAPLAKVTRTGNLKSLTASDRSPARQPDIVLVSSLSQAVKSEAARVFKSCQVVGFFDHYPYLGEMSGVLEISHAGKLADMGEIPRDARGMVICADVFGESSYLEFELLAEATC